MGGLEKIIDRIISNAKETAEGNINEARKKALEIEKDAKEKADYLKAQNEQKIIADCDKIKQMAANGEKPPDESSFDVSGLDTGKKYEGKHVEDPYADVQRLLDETEASRQRSREEDKTDIP